MRGSRVTGYWIGVLGAIALVAAAGAVHAATATTIFVSPTGDDKAAGTASAPVRTLTHARDLARAHAPGVTVQLADGTYRMTAPLTIDARDSGVTWTAAPGAHPVASGGARVSGWVVADPAKHLWSAPVPAGLTNTRQLYVNGLRATRAVGRLPVSLTKNSTGYRASAATMASWRNPGDIEFVYTGGNALWSRGVSGVGPWTEARCPVAGMSGTTVTMAQPCWDNSTRRSGNLVGGNSVNGPDHVENAFEVLDSPGEWYLDRSARKVYYISRPGEDPVTADIEAPVLETLVSAVGTASKPVHDVTFAGIRFAYATWLTPSTGEGFSEIQANYLVTGSGGYATQGLCDRVPGGTCPYGNWTRIHANLVFGFAQHITLDGDEFVHLGGAGIDFGDGTQNSVVRGSVFTDVSGNGMMVGGVGIVNPSAAQATIGNQVVDNHLFNLPAEYHGGVGVFVGYAQNTTVAHNQIDHTPYSAVSLGWGGWRQKEQKPAQVNPAHGNVVRDNLIFDHMLLLADGGAIYTNGVVGTSLADGEQLTGNVMHDQFGSGKTLYTDNGASYVTMKNNVLADNDYRDWGTKQTNYALNANGPMDVEGNWWQMGDMDTGAGNVTVKGNHVIRTVAEAAPSIVDNAGLEPAFRGLLSRTYGTGVPDAPSQVAVSAGDRFAYVSWAPPVNEAGAPVDSYTVTSSGGQQTTITAAKFQAFGYVKLSGLTDGTAYTFTVTASNAKGSSVASIASRSVTPAATAVAVPSAPKNVTAIATDGRATIRFALPSSNGGSPIVSYTIRGAGQTVKVTGRTILVLTGGSHFHYGVVEALTDGQSYTFTVTADNAAGSSAATSVTVVAHA
jgi:hypothetical protein